MPYDIFTVTDPAGAADDIRLLGDLLRGAGNRVCAAGASAQARKVCAPMPVDPLLRHRAPAASPLHDSL